MRLQIVHDSEGVILAAAQLATEGGPQPQGGDEPGEFDLVLPEAGEQVAELEVPAELADAEFHELVKRLQVDVKEGRLIERG